MRFITEDTNKGDVRDPLSLNLYTYCVGNPIRLVDVDGHAGRDVQTLNNQDGLSLTGGGGEVVYYLLDWLIKEGATVKDALRISYFLATTYYPAMTATDTIFSDRALEHIFHGNSTKRKASGYHHANIMSKATLSSISELDKNGVYTAYITIDGKTKFSSFFPADWNRTDVLTAIKESYNGLKLNGEGWYIGTTKSGMKIQMWIDENGLIDTAFPLYNK